jgi:hypothetical protein
MNEKNGVYGRTNNASIQAQKKWIKQDMDNVKFLVKHIKKLQRMKKI